MNKDRNNFFVLYFKHGQKIIKSAEAKKWIQSIWMRGNTISRIRAESWYHFTPASRGYKEDCSRTTDQMKYIFKSALDSRSAGLIYDSSVCSIHPSETALPSEVPWDQDTWKCCTRSTHQEQNAHVQGWNLRTPTRHIRDTTLCTLCSGPPQWQEPQNVCSRSVRIKFDHAFVLLVYIHITNTVQPLLHCSQLCFWTNYFMCPVTNIIFNVNWQ